MKENADEIMVTVWNEFRHEKTNATVKEIYPDGMHAVIADFLSSAPGIHVETATLDEPEHGLTQEVVDRTDVFIWWGHAHHQDVRDEVVERVHQRVLAGAGIILLHSAHFSKIFKRLMGTNCSLRWREAGEKERIWNVAPDHPITAGLGDYFEIPSTEMYGERFDIPEPDRLIFISWFEGGEVFRSGCTWQRGNGKVFYFRPGHETYPIFFDENVRRVILNAVRWCAPRMIRSTAEAIHSEKPLEQISKENA